MNKKIIIPLSILVVFLLIILGVFLMLTSKEDIKISEEPTDIVEAIDELLIETLPSFSFHAINKKGHLEYFTVIDGVLVNKKETDYTDVKDFYIEKIIETEVPGGELSEELKLKKEKLETLGLFENFIANNLQFYKGYIVYPYIIESGDYVWKIQSTLTPEISVAELIVYIEKLNGKRNLSIIYEGEEILFLIDDITNGYTKEDFEKKPAFVEEVIKEVIQLSNDGEFITTFDNGSVYAYSKEVNGVFKIDRMTLEPELLMTLDIDFDVLAFSVKGEHVYVEGVGKLYAYNFLGELISEIDILEDEKLIMLSNDFVSKSSETLISYSSDLEERETIPLHGELIDFIQIDNKLYLLSSLGNDIGKTTLYQVDLNDFKLVETVKINGLAENINIINEHIAVDYKIHKTNYDGNPFFLNYVNLYSFEELSLTDTLKLSSEYEKVVYANDSLQIYIIGGEYTAEYEGYTIDLSEIEYMDSIQIIGED